MPRRVTLSQLAAAAGVTKSTVSVALRDLPGVSPEKRERILRIAQELGYQPDASLRVLSDLRWAAETHRASNLALLRAHAKVRHPFPRRVEKGAREVSESLGYGLEVLGVCDYESEEKLARTLYHRGVKGVILGESPDAAHWPFLPDWKGFSVIQLESQLAPYRYHQVRLDFYGDLEKCCSAVLADGHERIGLLRLDVPLVQVEERRMAAWHSFRSRHARAIRSIPVLALQPGNVEVLSAWLERYKPTAVIDFTRIFLSDLRTLGLTIPGDLAYYSLHVMEPEKTSGILLPCEELGREAVLQLDLLVRQNICGSVELPRITLVPSPFRRGCTS